MNSNVHNSDLEDVGAKTQSPVRLKKPTKIRLGEIKVKDKDDQIEKEPITP